jgi:hypothetical protein
MFAGEELVLNGTATRGFFGLRIYEAALYLNAPSRDAAAIMEHNRRPKCLKLVMARAIPVGKFVGAVRENLDRNFSRQEQERFAGELEIFFACFEAGGTIGEGSEVLVGYEPGGGTILSLDGRRLAVIPGHDFYHALLRLWIGTPTQASMKSGLLGWKDSD